ncbi:MAG: hypothetical protein NVS1B4_14020 [Gemmatimonadaceae bacterium]
MPIRIPLFSRRITRAHAVGTMVVAGSLVAACHGHDGSDGAATRNAPSHDSLVGGGDVHLADTAPQPVGLSPLADSVGQRMTFPPVGQRWFLGAARGKRLLVDVGRVDAELNLKKDSSRLVAVRAVAERASPLPIGAKVRLYGAFGTEGAVVTGYDVWNGRVVATLASSPLVDSLARHADPFVVAVDRVDSLAGKVPERCHRDSISPALAERGSFVRDSMELKVREDARPPFERLQKAIVVRTARLAGCFGVGRILVVVSLRAGGTEYVVERYAVVGDSGEVTALRANDYRLKAHDPLYVLDADGDGIDDLAARGLGDGSGALTIMRLDPKAKRLERWVSGFAWEAR